MQGRDVCFVLQNRMKFPHASVEARRRLDMARSGNRLFGFAALALTLALGGAGSGPGWGHPGDPDWLFSSPGERRFVETIQGLVSRAEYDAAWVLTEQAVRRFPDSMESHRMRIQLARAMSRMERVLPGYADDARKRPDSAVARLCLALCYHQLNDLDAAEQELKAALAANPGFAQARHLDVQLARDRAPRDRQTQRLSEQFRREFPEYARGYVSEIGFLFTQQTSRRRIQAAIDAALRLPVPPVDVFDFQDNLNQRDLWYDPQTALPLYERAMAMDPDRVDLAVERALRLQALGRLGEAVEALETVVRTAPRYGQARLSLARILMDLHRYDEALAVLEKGLETVRYQDYYAPRAIRRRVDAFRFSGNYPAAEEELRRLFREYSTSPEARSARPLLLNILARKPLEGIRILPDVPFLAQKGNYCGPASLSMTLGYWGIPLDQDSIAREIYTGVAGTSPQVVREFARKRGFRTAVFEGSVELWKRLLDDGIPVLWLKMLSQGGGHYMLVVGYDDVLKEFILHNPHRATETTVSYSDIDDTWMLPSLRQSIILIPRDSPKMVWADELHESLRLYVINRAFYVITGSNLYRGLWPALAINLLVVLALALGLLAFMRATVCPDPGIGGGWFVALNVVMMLALNLIVAWTRVGQAASLLMAYFLACASLIPVVIVCALLRWLSHDWFRPGELYGLVGVVFLAWSTRAFIDDGHWQDRIPPLLIFLGALAILIPRQRMTRHVARARRGPVADPRAFLDPYLFSTKGRRGYYLAALARAELALAENAGDQVWEILATLRRARRHWPRSTRDLFSLHEAAAILFSSATKDSETDRQAAETMLRRVQRHRSPDTPLGAAAMALLAYCSATAPGGNNPPNNPLLWEMEYIEPLRRYLKSLKSWPRLPGVPRAAYTHHPHLLVRIIPLLIEQSLARVHGIAPADAKMKLEAHNAPTPTFPAAATLPSPIHPPPPVQPLLTPLERRLAGK